MFAERGFHGVSIAELGAACGISGPALYRHFPRKDAMLADLLVGISEDLLAEGRRRTAATASAGDALTALVRWHIEFALEHPDLIVVQDRDWSSLPVEARERVRTLQLGYVEVWVDVLVAVNPHWDRPTARAAAHAVFGLLNSTPHSARLSRGAMAELLEELALAAVTARGTPASGPWPPRAGSPSGSSSRRPT